MVENTADIDMPVQPKQPKDSFDGTKPSYVDTKTLPPCLDPVWCSIPLSKVSYFKFDPPTDPVRWRIAQIQASNGEKVLLQKVLKHFPNHFDFIDGDITFRKLHYVFDVFVDEKRDLSPLFPLNIAPISTESSIENEQRKLFISNPSNFSLAGRKLSEEMITAPKLVKGVLMYPWELVGKKVIPDPYDFRYANRAPVVSIGYTAYSRDSQTYFAGNRVGGAFIDRRLFFEKWRAAKDKIDTPLIAICSLNENWGFISTNFPNRTAGWGQCCNTKRDQEVFDFLNHDKTLMLVTNQHNNVTHPKLLTLPRGIPVTWGMTRVIVWDSMHKSAREGRKGPLLFAAASGWGPRPQILRCISKKFDPVDFDGHVKKPVGNRLNRYEYYTKLSSAMFGLGLPGLGYDCFRNWEFMTMGTIVVLEKGVGLDKTMYRLPALFLEDFDQITPELLREAYLEALYRVNDFEFERLTQSFWYSVIANVSVTRSVEALWDKFPPSAEDAGFARPKVPFSCWQTNSCGPGTKRIPKSSC